jgi:hypothetical protein
MRVNTKVHESMVERIKPGLRARIRVDSFANEELTGTVQTVQPLPDPASWMSSDVKVYTTRVTIDKGLSGLRPGMSAQVTILVEQIDDALAAPIQAILEFRGKDHVFVLTPNGPVRREVKVGTSNDKLIEIKEGLKSGEKVALNPTLLLTEQERREVFSTATKSAKKDWSGVASPGLAGGPGATKGQGGPGGGPGGGDPAKSKRKGGRGGAGGFGAFGAKFQNIPPEDRAKMKTASEEERTEILKKAGFTDEELEQMRQMRANGGFGGGGGGGGGFGGPGGGGGAPGGRFGGGSRDAGDGGSPQ